MKETLRQKLMQTRTKLSNRSFQLEQHIREYKMENKFEDAMKNQIKLDMIKIFLNEVNSLLAS